MYYSHHFHLAKLSFPQNMVLQEPLVEGFFVSVGILDEHPTPARGAQASTHNGVDQSFQEGSKLVATGVRSSSQ